MTTADKAPVRPKPPRETARPAPVASRRRPRLTWVIPAAPRPAIGVPAAVVVGLTAALATGALMSS
ncbi:hypothetical protein [Isoptericola croceus]|uniref:hypothetical protein n=1 Tax=Isoptericola croceus TaxID=3031406 RepID=UPI0023F8C3B8|nr:hypothetical protein [Isoptericola croceus]